MIRRAWGGLVKLLSSARLATLLLVFVGVWSMLASLVPQGAASVEAVASWASAHPLAENVVRILGLHEAFGAPLFMLCVLVLSVSTALCAWQRTKVAVRRGGMIRRASAAGGQALAGSPDLEITCDATLEASAVLSIAAETLAHLGIKTKRRDASISAVSPAWSVWGSPVFHWALLALIVTMPLGSMLRSAGQMGLAVGQTKIDEPASYGILTEGSLHGLFGVPRIIQVDAFEPTYRTGGVDRGPTPTVSVLDAQGQVIESQRVYPNNTLKTGSLTIYPSDYGLAATVALVDASGAEQARSVQLVDFSAQAAGGTAPAGILTVGGDGNAGLKLLISVPLDRTKGGFVGRLPKQLKVQVVATSVDDKPVLDRVLLVGEELRLPTGGALRLIDVGYYARLQLVDDPSIPVLYAGLVLAMLGLGVATLARQQIVTATVVESPGGRKLAVRMRLWRTLTSSRSEIESELVRALTEVERRDAT